MRRADSYRLERILETGNQLLQLLRDEGITRQAVLGDYRLQWQVTTPLYNIGEQVYCLSSEYKSAHPEVPWDGVAGLRHRLVHDYEGVRWGVVTSIMYDELPEFLNQVQGLLASYDEGMPGAASADGEMRDFD